MVSTAATYLPRSARMSCTGLRLKERRYGCSMLASREHCSVRLTRSSEISILLPLAPQTKPFGIVGITLVPSGRGLINGRSTAWHRNSDLSSPLQFEQDQRTPLQSRSDEPLLGLLVGATAGDRRTLLANRMHRDNIEDVRLPGAAFGCVGNV